MLASTPPMPADRWMHRCAITVVALTVFMISVGAMVTTTRAGDTDPTWSWRFWEWFQRFIHSEHVGLSWELGHRIVGTVIGFALIAMIVIAWRTKAPRSFKRLLFAVLIAVILQGALGGLRVLMVSSANVQGVVFGLTGGSDVELHRAAFAMVHGMLAQVTFALTVLLALMTSRGWKREPVVSFCKPQIRNHTLGMNRALILLILLQLFIGTLLRQTNKGLEQHIINAFIIALYAIGLALYVQRHHGAVRCLRSVSAALAFVVAFQIFLGFTAWMLTRGQFLPSHHASIDAVVRSAHVTTATTLLALSVVLYVLCRRHIKAAGDGAPPPSQIAEPEQAQNIAPSSGARAMAYVELAKPRLTIL
ncbi:MAG: COX15/CtaA family protein, partial [Planctomycetes bacterium]|nr:COX15/CtaA family protein [Planctomycetota bacterium]